MTTGYIKELMRDMENTDGKMQKVTDCQEQGATPLTTCTVREMCFILNTSLSLLQMWWRTLHHHWKGKHTFRRVSLSNSMFKDISLVSTYHIEYCRKFSTNISIYHAILHVMQYIVSCPVNMILKFSHVNVRVGKTMISVWISALAKAISWFHWKALTSNHL